MVSIDYTENQDGLNSSEFKQQGSAQNWQNAISWSNNLNMKYHVDNNRGKMFSKWSVFKRLVRSK